MKSLLIFRVLGNDDKLLEAHIYSFDGNPPRKWLDWVEHDMARKALDKAYSLKTNHLFPIIETIRELKDKDEDDGTS